MEQTSTPSLRTTENTIRMVAALKELDGAGVTELATHLSMSKSTVHDHLATLRRHDYVTKDGDAYEIGLGFFEMGEYARKRRQICEVARPEVTDLAEETGELANLLVEEHSRGVYLYRARGEKAVTLDTHTGKRRYLHDTALGKAILAHLPDDRVREILDRHGLPAATPNTITDRERLHEELAEIRERGVAYCGQKRVGGSSASQRRFSAGRRGAGGDQRGRPDYPAGGRTLRRGGPRTRAPGCERRGDQRHVQLIDVSPPVRLTTPHTDSNGIEGSTAVPLGGTRTTTVESTRDRMRLATGRTHRFVVPLYGTQATRLDASMTVDDERGVRRGPRAQHSCGLAPRRSHDGTTGREVGDRGGPVV
jgi:DNA-binding IclR family transcriptional regulator